MAIPATLKQLIYASHGYMHGREHSIEAPYRPTAAEAIEDARIWYSDLSRRERDGADCWVREYTVESLVEEPEEDLSQFFGDSYVSQVGTAVSTPRHVWQFSDDA